MAVGMEYANTDPCCGTEYLEPVVRRLSRDLPAQARVLDVGCGHGYWSAAFDLRGCEVVGIDPSDSGIALARRRCPGCRFEQLEVDHDLLARLDEAPFDLVVSVEVIEHLYDPQLLAGGAFNALKPGGALIVTTPYHGWLKNVALAVAGKFDGHHQATQAGGHIKFFSRRTLWELFAAAGFVQPSFSGAGRLPRLWKSMALRVEKPRR